MIHTATLLHDDVVDESALRRGHATANANFGNAASVLVGDFLYSRAFQLMVTVDNMRVLQILSDATNVIAEGEVMQLMNSGNPEVDEAALSRRHPAQDRQAVRGGDAAGRGAGQRAPATEHALARYGMHLGTAFQLIDDVLDYTGDQAAIGKNLGDDLAEGKPTLPLIRALQVGTPAAGRSHPQRHQQRAARRFHSGPRARCARPARSTTRARCAEEESRHAASCLDSLPPSTYRETLLELSAFAVTRTA